MKKNVTPGKEMEEKIHSLQRAWVKEWGTPRGCQGWAGKGPEWMEQRKARRNPQEFKNKMSKITSNF